MPAVYPIRRSLILPLLCLLLVAMLMPICMKAQSPLPTGASSLVEGDYVIPTGITSITMTAVGGNGGRAITPNSGCQFQGGRGAKVKGTYPVSVNVCAPGQIALRPGGLLRFIRGRNGQNGSESGQDRPIGSGGGGSAVLYQAPGSSVWQIIMVAGGGGGAHANRGLIGTNCFGGPGFDASLTTTATNGGGNYPGQGGSGLTGGNAGGLIAGDGGGGGGAFTGGGDGSILNLGGKQGFPSGGQGGQREVGASFVRGGFGFGGGGARNIAGGGGGGISGGGGGSESGFGAGGGGGSFVAPEFNNVERSVSGADLFDGGSLRVTVTFGANPLESARVYVNAAATGANDGSSWANAYTKLQDALANTCGRITEIWVAKGTYFPDEGIGYTNNSRTSSFILRNNLSMYGGFAGTETLLSQRNISVNPTILSGDIDQNDVSGFFNISGNSYHVVSNGPNVLNSSSVIDGFTISGGNASLADGSNNAGGGMYCNGGSPTVVNCRFTSNAAIVGGAMANLNAVTKISNCVFTGNRASGAGAMYNVGADVEITGCDFVNNTAVNEAGAIHNFLQSDAKILRCRFWNNRANQGGAVVNTESSYPQFVNSIFYNNVGDVYGGALFNFKNARATLINCSFSNNSASQEGSSVATGEGAALIATNCIFWGSRKEIFTDGLSTATVTYSIVQCNSAYCYQPFPGVGNLLSDPLFINAANGDLTLSAQSPALNFGNDAAITETIDLAGNPRKLGVVDLGAYELQIACPGTNIRYVNRNATGARTGVSWADAYTTLQDALADICPLVNQIWVARGTYYPDEGGGKTNNDRTAAFTMKVNVAIYGGFAGNETSLDQRNYRLNRTVLSGDIDQNDVANIPVLQLKTDASRTGNSFRVIENGYSRVVPLGPSARLDGFTITGANDNRTSNGGGMYNFFASPVVANCIFSQNSAGYGGGMCNISGSSPEIINCVFTSNKAELDGGGMANFLNSSPRITNSTFVGNINQIPGSPIGPGGALDNSSNSNTVMTNCIVWNNMGANSGFDNGITANSSTVTITNSLIQAGFTGTGNISTAPQFVNEAAGDFRLQPGSPAINSGDNTVDAGLLDLDANARRVGVIDMGAFESQATCSPISLSSNTLAPLSISGCNTSAIAGTTFAYSTTTVSLTAAQYNTINFGITANSCAVAAVSYVDVLSTALSTATSQVVIRTFTIRDVNNATANASQRITIEDKTAPVAIARNITAQLTQGGDVIITPQQVDNGSFDACGAVTLSLNRNRFFCDAIGQNIVTLTVADASGNVSRASAIVTVADNVAPTVITRNITAQINEGGIAVITPAMVDNGSFDACGIVEYSLDQTNFFCDQLGPNTVTLRIRDVNGNVGTGTAIVTVEDRVGPTIIAQNITAQITEGGIVEITPDMVDAGSFDACGLVSLTLSKTRFDCFDLGANTVTITARDVNGNESTANVIVTVEDRVPPTVFTRNITAQIDAGGIAVITPAMIDNGSFDACGIREYRLDKTSFFCDNLGPNTVRLSITDVNGNISSATAIVTVEDRVAPTVFTQNITAQITEGGIAEITASMVDAGTFDACGLQSISLSKTRFNCGELGPNTVVFTARDVNGNVSIANVIVTVEDRVAPTVFTQNITAQITEGGIAEITAAMVDAGTFDACGLQSISLSKTRFNCGELGPNTVVFTARDVNGNSRTANVIVTVEDKVAPTIFTRNITVPLNAMGTVIITPSMVDNGSFDACGIRQLSLDKTSFGCADVGANTVRLTITDVNGNISSATAIVTIEDKTAPTVAARNITVSITAGGIAEITAAMVDNGSTDACGTVALSLSKTRFDCSNVGTNSVVLTGRDVNGNTATATAIVTVQDLVVPTVITKNITLQLGANGTVTIADRAVDNGSFDACGLVLYKLNKTLFDCTNLGDNTVTLTVTDANNNTASGNAIVTVQGEATGAWIIDTDVDGFYIGVPVSSCTSPGAGYIRLTTQQPGDCDDSNNAINPGALEVCDGIDNNCNGQVDEGIVLQVPLFSFDTLICSRSAAPLLPATADNGISGKWSPASVSNTQPGSYTFTPDPGQCAAPVIIRITIVPLPAATIAGTTTVCLNAPTPAITLNGSGGTAPYTFQYSINNVLQTVTTLSGNSINIVVPTDVAGLFTYNLVSVKDAGLLGCAQSISGQTAAVRVNPLPTATITGTTTVCVNGAPTSISMAGLGGTPPYTFNYSLYDGVTTVNRTATGNPALVAVPLNATAVYTYTLVSVQDASVSACSQPVTGQSAVVTVNPLPDATITAASSVNALSTGNQAVVADAGTGAVYNWSISNGTITAGIGTRAISFTAGSSGAVSLAVAVTNGNRCGPVSSQLLVPITALPCPNPAISLPAAVCSGSQGNVASVANAGTGAVYVWSITNGTITGGAGTNRITFTAAVNTVVDNLDNDYVRISVRITNPNGSCIRSSGTYKVFISPIPNATITTASSVCAGSAGNVATVAFCNGAVYNWTIVNGAITSGAGTRTITYRAGSSGTVTLGVTVANGIGCSASSSRVVAIAALPVASITAPTNVCSGSGGNVASVPNAGTGTRYCWSISNGSINEGGNTNSIRFTAGNTGLVSLYVSVTNASGCRVTSLVRQVIISALPNAAISSWTSVCTESEGNRASVASAGTGARYNWTIVGGTITAGQGSNSIQYKAGVSGTIVLGVTVTGSTGCSSTATRKVKIIQRVTPLFTQIAPVCAGATAPALPTRSNNGISGTWSPSVVNTNAVGSTTYVFTPAPGICAYPVSMKVWVQNCNSMARRRTAALPSTEAVAFSATLHPNPSQAQFVLQLKGGTKTPVLLTVVDVAGRRIEQRSVAAGATVLLGAAYQRGVYFIEVVNGKERITLKAVKE